MDGMSAPGKAAERGALAQLGSAPIWAVAATIGAITMMWTTYEQYVPDFLGTLFGVPAGAIALLLTADNTLGFFLEPITGLLSDRTRTTLGQRLPWILLGTPLAVAFFALLPVPALLLPPLASAVVAAQQWLNPFLLFVAGMLVAMALFRTPATAIMPDLAASPGRSVANGLLQTMSGLGGLAALLLGDWLVQRFNVAAPFWLASAVMLGAAFFLWLLVARHQPEQPPESAPFPEKTRGDIVMLLAAIVLWWLGFVLLRGFFEVLAVARWNFGELQVERYRELFVGAFTVASIPAGLVAGRWGRRRTVALGSLALAAMVGLLLLVATTPLVAALLLLGGGVGWAAVTVNNLPMLLDLGPEGRLGTTTGLYYVAFALAGIVGPWLVRGLRGPLGEQGLWLALAAWLGALFLLRQLQPGAGEVEWVPD